MENNLAIFVLVTVVVIAAFYGVIKLIQHMDEQPPLPIKEEVPTPTVVETPLVEEVKVDLEAIKNPDAGKPFAKLSTLEASEKPYVPETESPKEEAPVKNEVQKTVETVEVKVQKKKKKKAAPKKPASDSPKV